MAKRPTRFERDLADLHGDADVEIIEMEPAEGPRRRYKVLSKEREFMADYPPLYRKMAIILGLIWSSVGLILSLVAVGGGLYLLWALFFL